MKKFALVGVAAAALAAVPALAVQQGSGPQPLTRAAVQARVQAHFAQVDADRDGFITQTEAETQVAAHREQRRGDRFARLDANGDGAISRAEFEAPHQRGERAERRENRSERRAERAERRGERRATRGMRLGARAFDRLDTDSDGRISLADVSARALARFDRMDANRDGIVSRDERRAMRDRRRARPQG